MKKLIILSPVYNEEECLPLFIEQVKKLEKQLSGRYVIDIFFSNNASTDSSLTILKKSSEIHDNIFFFTLSKNFGYQNSLQYALKNIVGDIFVIIDVDGEDPVEMILEFLDKYEKGYDIVYGKREDRVENYYIKKLRKLFYRLLKILSDDEIILDMAEFSLFTDEVRVSLLAENNSFPFIRSAISRVGYNKIAITYKRSKRILGKTNYNFFTMFKFAVAGILTSTTLPLRFPIYIFPFWLLFLVYIIYNLIIDKKMDTWNLFIIISIIFIITILIFSSLYLARTYKNNLNRPSAYVIKKDSKIKF
jgi:dolichol-phosphate mannosyltransferase